MAMTWGIVAGIVFSAFLARGADDPELQMPSLWTHFIDVRAQGGYRDNPTYTAVNPSGTTFATLTVEYTLARLPVDEWQVMYLSTVDATRFFDSDQADRELFTFNLLQVQKETLPGRHWEAGLQHVFQDQVIDASTTVLNQGSVAVRGHTVQAYGRWKQQWTSGWWIALRPSWEWQTLSSPLDDSVEPKIGGSVGYEAGPRISYSLSYSFQERKFLDRTTTDASGVTVGGPHLRFRQHEMEAVSRFELDEKKQWRLTLRTGWQRNEDNGGDYYTYDRCRMALDMRWRKKPWEIKLSSRASYYDYSVQAVAGPGSELREKTVFAAALQVRREIKNGFYIFVRGEHERSHSNLPADSYRANLVSLGGGWEN